MLKPLQLAIGFYLRAFDLCIPSWNFELSDGLSLSHNFARSHSNEANTRANAHSAIIAPKCNQLTLVHFMKRSPSQTPANAYNTRKVARSHKFRGSQLATLCNTDFLSATESHQLNGFLSLSFQMSIWRLPAPITHSSRAPIPKLAPKNCNLSSMHI